MVFAIFIKVCTIWLALGISRFKHTISGSSLGQRKSKLIIRSNNVKKNNEGRQYEYSPNICMKSTYDCIVKETNRKKWPCSRNKDSNFNVRVQTLPELAIPHITQANREMLGMQNKVNVPKINENKTFQEKIAYFESL